MFNWLKRNHRDSQLTRRAIPPERWQALIASRPALIRRDAESRDKLQNLATRILSEKHFVGGGDFLPDADACMTVALLAAQPLLELDLKWYRNFETFILYPGEFLADFEEMDEAGVMHTGRDLRAGEAWHRGPVVLSLEDIAESGLGHGYNVVVHELAHQIDQLNGEANGFPPLHRDMDTSEWTRAFNTGFERLTAEVEAGEEPWLDPYGAEHPAEFFAVCCEYFFDAPAHLAASATDIYAQLAMFFRQRPAAS